MSVLFMALISGSVLMISTVLSNRVVLANEFNALTEVTALSVLPSLIFDNEEDARQTLQTLNAHKNVIYAAVFKTDRQKIFSEFRRDGAWADADFSADVCNPAAFSLKYLKVCKPLLHYGIKQGHVVLLISLADIYNNLFKEMGVALLGLFFAGFLVFLMLEKVAERLSAPIMELVSVSEEVSHSGDYRKRAHIDSDDEIGRLGQAFNDMLEKIHDWNEVLKHQKDHLEEQVLERTRDLIEAKNKAMVLAEQAQKASNAKSEFLSIMSHEIRTPLNAVIGFSELLKQSELNQKQQEYIDLVNQSANALLNQINDILDFSKIEAGKMQMDTACFDIYRLLSALLASSRYQCERKAIQLRYDIAEDLPRYFYGDEQKIRQILYNLLNNAVKFTETGYVAVHAALLRGREGQDLIEIVIEDSGIGISEQQQNFLYEPFTQADASNTRKYGGTGLGLAIVKNLVGLLGGQIVLQSKLNYGTKFTAQLPLSTKIPPELKPVNQPLIALFEDAADLAFCRRLEQLQYRVKRFDRELSDRMRQDPQLLRPYQLLLFNRNRIDEAEYWDGWNRRHGEKKIIACLCDQASGKTALDHDRWFVDAWADNLALYEQINKLLPQQAAVSSTPTQLHRANILVVEDNPVNLLMVQNILKQAGFSACLAKNGLEAVKMFDSGEFDLVLMDCQMPVMDGFFAAREIRHLEMAKGGHVPIIALTASAFKEDREHCFNAGMDAYISKPFKPNQLLQLMQNCLRAEPLQTEGEVIVTATENDRDVLDETILNELLALDESGSKAFVSQLGDAYFTTTEHLLADIEKAMSAKTPEIIAKCAHQLKSSSHNVAAIRLAELCRELENSAHQSDDGGIEQLWDSINEEFLKVRQAYQAFLNA